MVRIRNKHKQINTYLKRKVFVAMSGGVDSSVSAALLKEQGYEVHGVFMQGWSNPRFECTWKEDRQDAARVAAVLDIPFRVIDYSRDYYERVVSYLISEYRAGRTPNPDVMCNKEIKFGLFFKWAMEQGADFIATGHYVRRVDDAVFIAEDKNKDQTYFLWTLTPEIISRTLFPIGDLTKPEVRVLARKYGLPVADKKDSQGVCFIGEGTMADFLRDEITTRHGDITTADGKKVGEHDGIELFTIGQRHGIGQAGGNRGPYYVAEKTSETATLIVAEGDSDPILYKKEIRFHGANWLNPKLVEGLPFECEARIRYRAPLARCVVYADLEVQPPNAGKVVFDEPQRAVARGQSIVFYKEGQLLGGGVIN